MSELITFELDGQKVTATPDQSIWDVAKGQGTTIPYLCHADRVSFTADGNCRACMVEIEGERVLAASCIRKPADGMIVKTATDRAVNSRKMVMELLIADQPDRETSYDPESHFWKMADQQTISDSRFIPREMPKDDLSHPAMAVNLDACINCNLCVRACRDVQVNDVIGMAGRGVHSKIVFDFDDPMGDSTCVGCGECVQACPTGALLEKSVVGNHQIDRDVDSVCPFCGVGCQLTFKVRDDKILFADGRDGPANEERLCIKGRFGFDYIHNPERLTVPLIRKEGIAKSDVASLDPANPFTHFREASWDEALEFAANGLSKVRNTKGGNALAGFGSAKGSNEEAYLFQKLVRTGFGTNNVDHCTRLCHASSVAALLETVGSGAVSAPFNEAENADVIMVIGSNPTVNHPVAATFFKNAIKKGSKLIVIDPRGQALSRHATYMLQEKPGTDVALLNSIMHVIIEDGLTDKDYIRDHTENFEELKEHLADFSPEAMAEITGIDPVMIREVAQLFAKAKAAIIFWGMGISQHVHGTDNSRCLISLSLMTGQVGRPGTGLHPLRGQNNVQGASDVALIPMFLPDYQSVEDPVIRTKFEKFWGAEIQPEKGLTVVEITEAIHRGAINAMYIMGENPAMSDPNVTHAREALTMLDHLVVQDLFLTETAAYADVVLPASAWPEKDGTVTNTNRQVQMGRAAVPMPGDARQDLWIIQEIAKRLGLDWQYSHPRDVFAEMTQVMGSIRGMSWERLEAQESIIYPCESPDDPGQPLIFTEKFPTANGLGKFVPASLISPDEIPDKNFPIILTTGRLLEHWHTGSMTRRSEVLDAVEPEPIVHMAPGMMEQLNAKPGDIVTVRSRRGEIDIRVRADGGVQNGMVFIPFCYAEAAVNLLTNDALDPFGKIAEVKFCAVNVERKFA
ncbi:formate dehydrogenase subunit alpha [uncultured Sneathiella sp.]|jgi:formate dehydrogenase major subunit|uniref:formate dehydrogenase subunit alpha n=1 Tax=uncultured Sneathiella sp. TaxID=879315 RepID=UPI0030DDA698|tara:strand:+ start:56006 stop:58744 length:2739 start_codon:yes stop_codon:yes gene_type:complete